MQPTFTLGRRGRLLPHVLTLDGQQIGLTH